MTAGIRCSREVDVIEPTDTVRFAASRMHDRKVGALVVVDGDCKPVGVLTDRDITVRVVSEDRDANRMTVQDAMTSDPTMIAEDMPIGEALQLMRHGSFRRLPVVDADGKAIGIFTLDDVLCLLCEGFEQIRDLIAAESPGSLADG